MRLSVAALFLFSTVAWSQEAQKLDSVMRDAEAKGFSGVVRVARRGSVVFEKGYGLANRSARIPFEPSTIVQIGSNTKDFTAIAILQLQDQGKLSVQDKLSRFFTDAPADKRDITLWQLMKHQAGFPLGLAGGDFAPLTREQFLDSAMAFKLLFAPGERQSYSNTGYAILAAIIEKVSGQTFDEYIRDNILMPLGLRRTGFLLPGFPDKELAHGYRTNGDDAGTMLSKPHATDGPYWNLRGNGGMLSTVADMHAFYRALFETEKLLKAPTRNLMFDPQAGAAFAGSDLVNFFHYERDPVSGIEILIASTNAAMRAPRIRGELARILGLPGAEGQTAQKSVDGPLARSSGKPVDAERSAIISQFIAAVNKADTAQIVKFIREHYVLPPDQPPAEERANRLLALHDDIGDLSIVQGRVIDNGTIQVVVKAAKQGEALLILDMETTAPYRIRRIGIQVGGD